MTSFLKVVLLVWAALVVQAVLNATAVSADQSVGLQNDELEGGIISQVDSAIQLFQNADLTKCVPATEAIKCTRQVRSAVQELSWVKAGVKEGSSLDHSTIQQHLHNAIQDVAECANQSVFLSTGLAKVEAVSKQFQETVRNYQSDVGQSYIDNKGDRDGTTCQYSSFGRGQKLVNCVYGYAGGVTGGANGRPYVVTNAHDDPQNPIDGSLRYGIHLSKKINGGIWITFSRDLLIVLQDMLWVHNSTTIDGRGFNITITGASIVMGRVSNIIIHNLQINNLKESDTIHIFAHSRQIWIDHVTSFNAHLGLFSVLQGSTDVTISNSFLTNPNFNVLLGASDADDDDKDMRVTIFRNWFKDSMQRMPHCRWGVCHVINNLYTNWGYYALGARVYGKIYSEHNVYIPQRRLEVTSWHPGVDANFDQTGTIISSNDHLANGATFHQSQNAGTTLPSYKNQSYYPPKFSTGILTNVLQHCVGALFGQKLELCLLATN